VQNSRYASVLLESEILNISNREYQQSATDAPDNSTPTSNTASAPSTTFVTQKDVSHPHCTLPHLREAGWEGLPFL
jgi:hypothetical protein